MPPLVQHLVLGEVAGLLLGDVCEDEGVAQAMAQTCQREPPPFDMCCAWLCQLDTFLILAGRIAASRWWSSSWAGHVGSWEALACSARVFCTLFMGVCVLCGAP